LNYYYYYYYYYFYGVESFSVIYNSFELFETEKFVDIVAPAFLPFGCRC
jgi:hypothetical protein